MENESSLNQYIVPNLQLGCMYKFTVCGQNAKGTSFESAFSNAVMVERELPSGWFRFYDAPSERFYYSNLKTKQSSWVRPDDDPYFADESVILEFSAQELVHLRALFDEEMAHFDLVTIPRIRHLLLEIGHPLPASAVRGICNSLELDAPHKQSLRDTRVGVRLYQDYMMFMLAVKLMTRERSWTRRFEKMFNVSRSMYLGMRASLYFRRDAMHWTTVYDPFVCKPYFLNTRSHVRQWHMPEELRFYTSPALQVSHTPAT